jgi:hypothetical protein
MTDKLKVMLPNPFSVDYAQISNGFNLYTETQMLEFAQRMINECIKVLESQQISVGNSRSGEIAAEMTIDALRDCRDDINAHFGITA